MNHDGREQLRDAVIEAAGQRVRMLDRFHAYMEDDANRPVEWVTELLREMSRADTALRTAVNNLEAHERKAGET